MTGVPEELLDRVRLAMRGIKVPGAMDKVHKDECMVSFDSPESPGGLFVNMHTLQGFGDEYVALDHKRSGCALYLHEKWHKIPIVEDANAPVAKPEKMAIGGEGGFQVDAPKHTIEKVHSLVLLPDRATIPLPCADLPELVLQAINAIIAHESVSTQEAVAAWEEERRVSKYAEGLPQLDSGRKVGPVPADWKCDETGATENLWLNLSTGHIGSGRANWDGSGGNGSALRHYEATGRKYPLVVKLGTITPHGADVYSYAQDEDDMVTDPWLAQHLAHWGINMLQMQKTVKTMAELSIDLNMRTEFNKITESGTDLKPLTGPGYTGLINLGNSCYMNSVLQVVWSIPELVQRYAAPAQQLFESAPADIGNDLVTQMAKVGVALVNGRVGHVAAPATATTTTTMDVDAAVTEGQAGSSSTAAAKPVDDDTRTHAVRPSAFKTLVGRGHAEFASARQQDAVEYFQHLLDLVARTEHANAARLGVDVGGPSSSAFTFLMEDRIQCMTSGCVTYRKATNNVLNLTIPLDAAINMADVEDYKERDAKRQKLKAEHASAYIGSGDGSGAGDVVACDVDEDPVIPQVPFDACLQRLAAAETMDDYLSAALGRKTLATKRARFATFPPYLAVQLKRYYVAQDWTPKKMEVHVPMPDRLDLESLRSTGVQPGEQLQPEEPVPAALAAGPAVPPAAAAAAAARVEPDEALVMQLVSMGFGENGCRRAALAVNNSGVEAAMEWVLGHMGDDDFNDPLPAPVAAPAPAAATAAPASGASPVDPEKVSMLTGMGFTDEQAGAALKACSGSIERAADWLFSHMDDLDAQVTAVLAQGTPAAAGAAPAVAGGSGSSAAGGPPGGIVDGPGTYELLGFVSHMGSNTACGHYVAHIKKDGRWVIFNDEKVAESAHPPLDLGYLYFYRRVAQ